MENYRLDDPKIKERLAKQMERIRGYEEIGSELFRKMDHSVRDLLETAAGSLPDGCMLVSRHREGDYVFLRNIYNGRQNKGPASIHLEETPDFIRDIALLSITEIRKGYTLQDNAFRFPSEQTFDVLTAVARAAKNEKLPFYAEPIIEWNPGLN